jgi:Cof subfamily protein (haloacid dehalogenase superfamily)
VRPKQQNKIELVAFDLDGTLVGRDNALRPAVREEILRVGGLGIRGCLVTGRMYQASLPFARALELVEPLICYQGAAIVDPQSDKVLFDEPLANETALDVVAVAKREALHVQLYRNDKYYCEARNRFSDLYAQISGVEPVIVNSLEEAFASSDATKAVIIADAGVAARCVEALQTHLAGRAYVTRSYPEFVEILNPRVDKGKALEFVARRAGIEMGAVLAIGDSWNDVPLLSVAGIKVAMGNAPEELRRMAERVVGDVASDGVAEALRYYFS